MSFEWTPERCDELRRLHAKGFSFGQIVAEMGSGLTRNAAIGKASRMGLPDRLGPRPKPKSLLDGRLCVKQRRPRRSIAECRINAPADISDRLPPREMTELPMEISDCAVSLWELTDKTCRWPVGEACGAEQMFCGAIPFEDAPYCARHCRFAYKTEEKAP